MGSPERAAGYYETAASLTTDQFGGLRLTESAAQMSFLSRQYEKSLELYEQASRATERPDAMWPARQSATRALPERSRADQRTGCLSCGAVQVLAANEEVAAEAEPTPFWRSGSPSR